MLASARSDRVKDAMVGVQKTRAWVEDLQDGALHMVALPTRQDVRRLQRRVDTLRRRMSQIDVTIAELEAELERLESSSEQPPSDSV
ncbi:MAG: hypothetical protein AAF449_20940 [Myxococcota bacterium]